MAMTGLPLLPPAAVTFDEEPSDEAADGDRFSCVMGGVSEGVTVMMSEDEECVVCAEGLVMVELVELVELPVDSDIDDSCAVYSLFCSDSLES